MKALIISFLLLFAVHGTAQNNNPHIIKRIYTDKAIYVYGQKIIITIRAINTSSIQDTLMFVNGCEAYPFIDSVDYLTSFFLGCEEVEIKRVIPANDSIQWVYEYPHLSKPNIKLPIGQHRLFGYFQNGNTNSDTINFAVKPVTNLIANESQNINFLLNQNYPNPFNPSTAISFSLSKQSFVSLIVYDLLGQETAILINKELPSGNHSVIWNPNNLSSGIYYYKIIAENNSKTKKLIFAK